MQLIDIAELRRPADRHGSRVVHELVLHADGTWSLDHLDHDGVLLWSESYAAEASARAEFEKARSHGA